MIDLCLFSLQPTDRSIGIPGEGCATRVSLPVTATPGSPTHACGGGLGHLEQKGSWRRQVSQGFPEHSRDEESVGKGLRLGEPFSSVLSSLSPEAGSWCCEPHAGSQTDMDAIGSCCIPEPLPSS